MKETTMDSPLADRLRALRKTTCLSGEGLASRLQLTLPALMARERGERSLYPHEVRAYLSALAEQCQERRQGYLKARQELAARPPGTIEGGHLRALRRAMHVPYEELAGDLQLHPETLRSRELATTPWEAADAEAFLQALDARVAARQAQVEERLRDVRRTLPRRVVPAVRREGTTRTRTSAPH
jgi:hypothetical protein